MFPFQRLTARNLRDKVESDVSRTKSVITFGLTLPLLYLKLFNYLKLFHSFLPYYHLFFWLHGVSIAGHGLSLVAARGGYSLVVVHRLLVAETGSRAWAQ